MRRALGLGLATVMAVPSGAWADPAAPQLAPIHLQREDAQRLREQQRSLEAPTGAPTPSPPGASIVIDQAPPAQAPVAVESVRGAHVAGGIMLGLSGVCALIAIGYASASVSDTTNPSATGNNNDSIAIGFTIASLTLGITGIVLVTRRPKVILAPTVTTNSIGVAFTGRL